jgi:hypothetical protein
MTEDGVNLRLGNREAYTLDQIDQATPESNEKT